MSGLTIMVAATPDNGIGQGGKIPWHIRKDLSCFSHVTSAAPDGKFNALIMGRGTWESLPGPLKNRLNVVLSRYSEYPLYVQVVLTSKVGSNVIDLQALPRRMDHRQKPPYIQT